MNAAIHTANAIKVRLDAERGDNAEREAIDRITSELVPRDPTGYTGSTSLGAQILASDVGRY